MNSGRGIILLLGLVLNQLHTLHPPPHTFFSSVFKALSSHFLHKDQRFNTNEFLKCVFFTYLI